MAYECEQGHLDKEKVVRLLTLLHPKSSFLPLKILELPTLERFEICLISWKRNLHWSISAFSLESLGQNLSNKHGLESLGQNLTQPPGAIRIDSLQLTERIDSLQDKALIGRWHFPELNDNQMRDWLEAQWKLVIGYIPIIAKLLKEWFCFHFLNAGDLEAILKHQWVYGRSLFLYTSGIWDLIPLETLLLIILFG